MRVVTLGILSIFTVLCFSSIISADEKQYVEVKAPFANVYKELDPKSEIIKQAKKGDHLELVFEGTSWYHVKVKESFGWVEKKAGEVVDNPGAVSVVSVLLLLLLIGGTAGGVYYYISKSKVAGA